MCHRAHKLRKSERAKLRTCGGFSLPELILTMFIILLATGIAVDGIPAVIRAYQRTVDVANAETYLNTVTISLRNRLSFASWDKDNDAYIDPKTGRFQISNSDNGIQIQEGVDMDADKRPPPKPLAPNEKKPPEWWKENEQRKAEFISSYTDIILERDFFKITGLEVTKNGEELAKLDSPYYIRRLNP